MKKLFLASSGLSALEDFVEKSPANMKMLFIPTAGNPYDDKWWIDKDREVLAEMGFDTTEVELEDGNETSLRELVDDSDIVYVAGGNTFYLLQYIRLSGFDKILEEYLDQGGLYAGASAGALVAGVDIEPIASLDEPEKAPELESTEGLKYVDIIPVPHYDMKGRTEPIEKIYQEYGSQYEMVLMTDDQAIVVEGDKWKLIDSVRNVTEAKWCDKHIQ
jgi:dipeptidase E